MTWPPLKNLMTRTLSSLFILFLTASALAAGRELEAPVIGPTGFNPGLSSTAFAGDRFLTVWQHMSGTEVFGTFSDARGKRISLESFRILDAPRVWSMQLIGLGNAYALFWSDQFGGVHHAEIDLDGSTARTTRLPTDIFFPRAAWNGETILLAGAQTGSSLPEALLLSRAGEVLRRTPLSLLGDTDRVVALRDGSFLVIGRRRTELKGVTISRSGEVVGEVVIGPRPVSADRNQAAALPLAGGGAMVASLSGTQEITITILTGLNVLSRRVLLLGAHYAAVDTLHLGEHDEAFVIYFRGHGALASGAQVSDLVALRIDAEGRQLAANPLVVAQDFPQNSALSYGAGRDISLAVGSRWGGQVLSYALTSPIAPSASEILSLTPSAQSAVGVGGNARGFLAVWSDLAGDYEVHAASVDAAGHRTSAITVFPGYLLSGKLASGPAEHLFIRVVSGQLIASLVTPEGALLRDVPLQPSIYPFDAASVWTGSGFLVAWSSGEQIFTAVLSSDGSTPVVNPLPLPALPPGYGRGATKLLLAFDGKVAMLVWDDTVRPNCGGIPGYCFEMVTSVLASRISPSGVALDRVPTVLTTQLSPLLAGGDGRFLLYTHQDRSTRVITAGGSTIQAADPTAIPLGSYTVEDLIWDGVQYVAATRAAGRYAGVLELDSRGRAGTPMRSVPATGWINSVRVAASNGEQLVVGSVSGRSASSRASAFGTPEFRVVPPPPPANTRASVGLTAGGETLLTWEPVPDADGYAIEVIISGQHFATIVAGKDATSVETAYPVTAEYRVRPFNAGGFFQPPVASRRRTIRQ